METYQSVTPWLAASEIIITLLAIFNDQLEGYCTELNLHNGTVENIILIEIEMENAQHTIDWAAPVERVN